MIEFCVFHSVNELMCIWWHMVYTECWCNSQHRQLSYLLSTPCTILHLFCVCKHPHGFLFYFDVSFIFLWWHTYQEVLVHTSNVWYIHNCFCVTTNNIGPTHQNNFCCITFGKHQIFDCRLFTISKSNYTKRKILFSTKSGRRRSFGAYGKWEALVSQSHSLIPQIWSH